VKPTPNLFVIGAIKGGTTPLRATAKHPDGPQSHCTACRGGNAADGFSAVLCSEK